MAKPVIIVSSPLDADVFDWMSDGWYTFIQRGTPIAESLMRTAKSAIEDGDNVADAIHKLEEAGFEVRHQPSAIRGEFGDRSN